MYWHVNMFYVYFSNENSVVVVDNSTAIKVPKLQDRAEGRYGDKGNGHFESDLIFDILCFYLIS